MSPITPQDESAGSEQGRHKDREVDEGEQEDKESGKQANFYFRGLTPFTFLQERKKMNWWKISTGSIG